MRHKRGYQIVRQWRILIALAGRGWLSIDEIRMAIPAPQPHRRTIMRDLEILTHLFPIEHLGGGSGGCKFQFRLRWQLAALLNQAARTKGKYAVFKMRK